MQTNAYTNTRPHAMRVSEFTWVTYAQWPDGDLLPCEARLDKDSAFDVAAERFGDGCAVRVEVTERDPATGMALGVSDATALFFEERGIDPDRHEPCGYCHRAACTCDDAYDQGQADDFHGWAAQ